MVATYRINSPLNREERTNLNDSLQDALSRLISLQRQVNIISGDQEIQLLIETIERIITEGNASIEEIQTSIESANQYLTSFEQAEKDIKEVIDSANESIEDNTRTVDDLVIRTEEELGVMVSNTNDTIQGIIDDVDKLTTDLSGYNIPIESFVITKAYVANQAVRFNGSTYRAKANTQNNSLPTNSEVENEWWTLEAQRGVDGNGAVSSVANILPGIDGNVVLTPTDIGALGTEHLYDQVHRHVEIVNVLPTDYTGRGVLFKQVGATANTPSRPSYDEILENTNKLTTNVEQFALNAVDLGAKGDANYFNIAERKWYQDASYTIPATDNLEALQAAIILSETTGNPLFIPKGTYYLSDTLHTRHQPTYHYRPGTKIFGVGKDSKLVGNGAVVPDPNIALANQALLSVHSSNNEISGLSFERCAVGLYLGQDPSQTSALSHASFNKIDFLFFYYSGYAYVLESGEGCYYNKTHDIHIAHTNIGLYMKDSGRIAYANNNRNYFTGMRVNRAWIGYLIEDGDGNTFDACYSEAVNGDSQATGSVPTILQSVLDGKASAWVLLAKASNNRINSMSVEACTNDIYDSGEQNSYITNYVVDGSVTPKVIFTNPAKSPAVYLGAGIAKIGTMEFAINNGNPFGNVFGVSINNGRIFDKGFQKQTIDLLTISDQITGKHPYSRSIYSKLGNVVDWDVHYRFSIVADNNDALKIKLPHGQIPDSIYRTALTGTETFKFKVSVRNASYPAEDVDARFATTDEASEFGGNHVIIPAPTRGWNATNNSNYLTFKLRYSL